jgi:hypothetical protein
MMASIILGTAGFAHDMDVYKYTCTALTISDGISIEAHQVMSVSVLEGACKHVQCT